MGLEKKIKESRGVPVGQCHPIGIITDSVIIAICVLCAGLLCCLVALYILYGQVSAPAPKQKEAVPGAWAFAPEAPVPMHLKPKRFTQMKINMSNFASTIFGKKKKQSMYEQPVPSMAMQPVPSMQPMAEEEEDAAQSLKSMSIKNESSPPVARHISHRNRELCQNSVSGLPMSVPASAFAHDLPRSRLKHDLGATIPVELSRKLPLPDPSTSLPLHSLSKRAKIPDSIRRAPVLDTLPESPRPEKRRSVNSPSSPSAMVKPHAMKSRGKGKGKGRGNTRLQIDPAALGSPSNMVPGPTKTNMTLGATKSKKEFKGKGKGTRRAV